VLAPATLCTKWGSLWERKKSPTAYWIQHVARILKLHSEPYYRAIFNTDTIKTPESKTPEHSYFSAWIQCKNLQGFLHWCLFEILFKIHSSPIYLLVPLATIHCQLEKRCQERTQKCCQSSLMCPCIYLLCNPTEFSNAWLRTAYWSSTFFQRKKNHPKQSIFIHHAYYCGFYHVNSKDSFTVFWGHEPYYCITLPW